jgi:hypothetical protein
MSARGGHKGGKKMNANIVKFGNCKKCAKVAEFVFNGIDCQESCPTCKATPDQIMVYRASRIDAVIFS